MTTTKAIIFVTHSIPNTSGETTDPALNGIDNDAVNLTTVTTHSLVNGSTQSAFFDPDNYTPGAITFDAPLQTYYTYLEVGPMAQTFYGDIFSGSTTTGTLSSTPIHTVLTAQQISDDYYGYVNDIVDDPANHKLYFTQQVTDFDDDVIGGQTGIFVMNESGGTATQLPISGLTDPNVLAIDLADNLVFFTQSTGPSTNVSGTPLFIEKLEVASLTPTGTAVAPRVLASYTFTGDAEEPGVYGGPSFGGIAVDPTTHTLYWSTYDYFDSPASDDAIYKATFTPSGTGTATTATLGTITTLYSGTNSFNPTAITLDVPDGVFYVPGTTPTPVPGEPGEYTGQNPSVYEGSLTATNTTALTLVTSVATNQLIEDVAADVAPVLVAGSTVTWDVGNAAVATDAALTATAATSPNFLSATVVIGTPQTGDTLAATTTGTSITASFASGTLTLSGTDTAAHYQQVLDSVTFTSTAGTPTAGARTLTYSVFDGIISSPAVTSTVTVQARPTVTAGATATFTGGGSAVVADAGLTLTAAGNLTGATISIAAGHVSGDVLGFIAQNGISGGYNATTGVLTLSGTASAAHYQTAIDSVTFGFSPSNADPTNGGAGTSRTISYVATDSGGSSATATSTVTVIHAAPSIIAGAAPTYLTGGAAVAIDPALTVTAPDSGGAIASATVTISGNHATGDTLNFTNQTPITGSYNSTTGVLSLMGSGTAAQYQTAIDSITFSSTDTSSTSTRTITYTVNDGTAPSAGATSMVIVQHPTPTVTGTAAGQGVSDAATIAPFAAVTINDSTGQQDSATITLTASGTPTDANGALSLGTGVTKTGTGTYTVAATTPAGLTTSLRALVFTPTAHQVAPGTTVTTGFSLAITDTGAGSTTNTATTVIATAATDTPVIAGTSANQPTTDLLPVSPFAMVSITDPDFGVTPTVTITLRSAGTATDANGTLSGAGLTPTGTGTYTLTDTPTNLTTELRNLTFTPTHDQVPVGQVVSTEFDLLAAVGGVSASDTTTSVNATDVPCYCRGTLILTITGEVPVEDLAIGDLVATHTGALEPIRWIGRRSYVRAFSATNPQVWPVLIRAGALEDGIPQRDLSVSPEHAMFISGVLIPARLLVNGSSIVAEPAPAEIHYFHIELESHGVIYAEGAPAETFLDCGSRGRFHNAADFAALYPGAVPAKPRFCAPVIERGRKLAAIQKRLTHRAEQVGGLIPQSGPLQGCLDRADRWVISGWAALPQHPGIPVRLQVLDHGAVIATAIANEYRPDLDAAGIDGGRHAFHLQLATPLDPFVQHEIAVRRASDGAPLHGSPIVLQAALSVDATVRQGLSNLLDAAATRAADADELDAVLRILGEHMEPLRRARSRLRTPPSRRRGGADRGRWALVIDHGWPQPERGAGSQALLSHMQALQRLGWQVTFVPVNPGSRNGAARARLCALGITCEASLEAMSVEQVLREAGDRFALVYLHRQPVVTAYLGLVRQHLPRARCVYSVGGLRHVEIGQQAEIERRPELLRTAQALKWQDYLAVRQVDAVITHSTAEATLLTAALPGAAVHVVPWAVRSGGQTRPWPQRSGLIFVANFGHTPNSDGLQWLVEAVMPLVWAQAPEMELTVVGANVPSGLRHAVADPRARFMGAVADLAPLYGGARVALAPLRYGAGLSGQVLEAWAAGLPCAMTPIAAEALVLPAALTADVAAAPAEYAARVLALHGNAKWSAVHVRAGRAVLRQRFSMAQVMRDLDGAVAADRTPVVTARLQSGAAAS